MKYQIKSHRGYWLQGAFGYTSKRSEAGVFSKQDLLNLNLDGCTLLEVRDLVSAADCASQRRGKKPTSVN